MTNTTLEPQIGEHGGLSRGDVVGTVRTSRLFRTRYPRAATTARLGPERTRAFATNLAPVLQHAQPPSVLPQANEPCWCGSGRKYKRCHKPLEGRVLQGIVSPRLEVPAHIDRPPYADTGVVERWAESRVKSPEIIERMRHAGAIAAEVLRLAGEMVQPGVTTDAIDRYVHQLCIDRDAYPSPLNYGGFPKSVCTSVNEVICHGIPDSRELQDGDIVNIDVTCYVGGVHGDTNATFFVGDVDPASRHLVQVTEECTWYGIEAVVPGRPLSDIGRAIESHAKKHKYGVVKAFIGHGIGEQFHTDIQVLHYYDQRANMVMRPGMTFTIEPMITMGAWQHKMVFDDDWTAITADGKRTAQFEHTCLVTDDGVEVLTAPGAASPTAPWRR
jgi:methionyl aminopeptidase